MPKHIAKFPRNEALAFAKKILSLNTIEEVIKLLRSKAKEFPKSPKKIGRREYFLRLAKGFKQKKNCMTIFGMDGNAKLPFVSFSTLPIVTCPGHGDCANWCYSLKSWQYPNAYARQLQNTLLLKFFPEVIAQAFLELPQNITLRLYVDGDFGSLKDVEFWMSLLSQRQDIQAYGYSKSWDELWAFHEKYCEWPENYTLNISNGGIEREVSQNKMIGLPITRGQFFGIPTSYKKKKGFAKYDDPEYHREVRRAAEEQGLGKVMSCPGKCGDCTGIGHACGQRGLKSLIVISVH